MGKRAPIYHLGHIKTWSLQAISNLDSIHFYSGQITPIDLQFNYKQMLWNEPTLKTLAICILAIVTHTHTDRL